MKTWLFSRRKALLGLSSLAGSCVLSASPMKESHLTTKKQPDAITYLISRLPRKADCVALGELCYQEQKLKMDFNKAYQSLNHHLASDSPLRINQAYRAMVKQDFNERKVVNIKGLILADSEASLYTFAYLLAQNKLA